MVAGMVMAFVDNDEISVTTSGWTIHGMAWDL